MLSFLVHRPTAGLGPFFVLTAACSGAPHAPPAPIEDPSPSAVPVVTSSSDAISPFVAVLHPEAGSNVIDEGPLRAEVIPGMERIERVSLLEQGLRCGTRISNSPVCVGDDRNALRSLEGLSLVKRLEARNGTHCSLLDSGKLACSVVNATSSRAAPLVSTAVEDFVIGVRGEVFALSSGGNVVATEARDDGTLRTKIILRSVTEIAKDNAGVCARTGKGNVECSNESSPLDRATRTVNGLEDVVEIDTDGVIRKNDNSIWMIGLDRDNPFQPLRLEKPEGTGVVTALAIGWEPDRCLLTTDGGVSCFDASRSKSFVDFASRQVELPRRAVKMRPRGAPCAELDNGTVACWGELVPELKRLGLHTLQLSPGSLVPRP